MRGPSSAPQCCGSWGAVGVSWAEPCEGPLSRAGPAAWSGPHGRAELASDAARQRVSMRGQEVGSWDLSSLPVSWDHQRAKEWGAWSSGGPLLLLCHRYCSYCWGGCPPCHCSPLPSPPASPLQGTVPGGDWCVRALPLCPGRRPLGASLGLLPR